MKKDYSAGDSLFKTSNEGITDERTMITGIVTDDGDHEDFEEETEEMFLQMAAQASGGKNAPANNNQISKQNYAAGNKTEYVKNPCNVVMVAEKPSIA